MTAVVPRVAGAAPPEPIALRVSSARSRARSDSSASSAAAASAATLWSRWRVSALSVPVTRPSGSDAARLRPVAMIITAARIEQDRDGDDEDDGHGGVCSYSSKKMPSFHGNTKLNPGPRKNEPMITSTAQNIRKIVKMEIANLRSSGLCDGFLSM